MKICLFGGTFDPPHIGHLLIAQTVFEAEKFDKVIFVPANKPPNKKAFSPQATRVEMLKLAVEGNPNFEISDINLSYKFDDINKLLLKINLTNGFEQPYQRSTKNSL